MTTQHSTFSVGFSPCPNDTFIFYHLLHHQPQWILHPVIEDVERLNRMALGRQLDFTKVSMAAYPLIENDYTLLDAGAALGFNSGPLLITKPGNDMRDLGRCTVAIPGLHTTANLLLSQAFPEITTKHEMVFSEIEDAILQGAVDAGVIIHESRFTYEKKGLIKVVDLGTWWQEKTQLPIPLGGIVAKRSLCDAVIKAFDRSLAESVRFALDQPDRPLAFAKRYAHEMDAEVMQQHIQLYVNDFSVSLGEQGHQAVGYLLGTTLRTGR